MGSEDFRLLDTDAPNPPERDDKGRFLPGNTTSVKTGLHTTKPVPEVFRQQEIEVRDFLEQSLADDGGRNEIPTRRLSQHQYRAALHRQILRLNAALETHGLFDRRGKLRVAWLSKLESLMREARAFDQSLGLRRRPRHVSLDEYLKSTYADSSAAVSHSESGTAP